MPDRASSWGHGYTDAKSEHLLDIIEEILLEGMNDWMCVQEQHMLYYQGAMRICNNLKHKLQALYN